MSMEAISLKLPEELLEGAGRCASKLPLTTNLIDEVAPLRIRVSAREDLPHDSDLLIDQLRAIDNKRLMKGPLARLDSKSMRRVGLALLEVLDLTAILDPTD